MEANNVRMISAEKAVEILKKNGVAVSIEQASLILDFLYRMANVAVEQLRRDEEGKFIHSG